ncbi:hypothetical protein FQR65_LT20343 [Abscondita terminalis]|nr:hypothetical protein FQR65_LT20343 [Abscondita terminalis]
MVERTRPSRWSAKSARLRAWRSRRWPHAPQTVLQTGCNSTSLRGKSCSRTMSQHRGQQHHVRPRHGRCAAARTTWSRASAGWPSPPTTRIGHACSSGTKAFMDANGADLRLQRPGTHRNHGVQRADPEKSPAKSRPDDEQSGEQPNHQFMKPVQRVQPADPAGGADLNCVSIWGAGPPKPSAACGRSSGRPEGRKWDVDSTKARRVARPPRKPRSAAPAPQDKRLPHFGLTWPAAPPPCWHGSKAPAPGVRHGHGACLHRRAVAQRLLLGYYSADRAGLSIIFSFARVNLPHGLSYCHRCLPDGCADAARRLRRGMSFASPLIGSQRLGMRWSELFLRRFYQADPALQLPVHLWPGHGDRATAALVLGASPLQLRHAAVLFVASS